MALGVHLVLAYEDYLGLPLVLRKLTYSNCDMSPPLLGSKLHL